MPSASSVFSGDQAADPDQAGSHRAVGSWQQRTGLEFALSAAAHPFGNECALILGYRPTDWEQQLIVRVLAHRPIQKHHFAAEARPFFEQQHLMRIVAGHPMPRGVTYLATWASPFPGKWITADERRLPKPTCTGDRRQPKQAILSSWSAIRRWLTAPYARLGNREAVPTCASPDHNSRPNMPRSSRCDPFLDVKGNPRRP